jgi:hypothetical protein
LQKQSAGLYHSGRKPSLPLGAKVFDTHRDQRLSRIFSKQVIKIYPAFRDFTAWKIRSAGGVIFPYGTRAGK